MDREKKIAKKKLKTLAYSYSELDDKDIGFCGYDFRYLKIPDHYNYNKSRIVVSGNFYRLCKDFFNFLENERNFEYMKRDSRKRNFVKSELRNFILDIHFNKKYKDIKILEKRIDLFLNSIYEPLEEFKVVIPINYFDSNGNHYFEVEGAVISKIDFEKLKSYILDSPFCENDLDFINKSKSTYCITVIEEGNDIGLVTERARKKARKALDIFRLYYYQTPYKTDVPKYFRIGNPSIIYDLNDKIRSVSYNHDDDEPYFGFLDDECAGSVNDLLLNLKKLDTIKNNRLKDRIKRTIYWLGKAIIEFDLDICLILYCTALESLLIPEIEGKKGEVLALRVALIEKEMIKSILDPSLMLKFYEIRSKVVHGTDHEISKDEFIDDLEFFIRRILYPFIDFACENPKMSLFCLIKKIETFENVLEVFWLSLKHSGEYEYSIKLLNYLLNTELLGDNYIEITKKGIKRLKEQDSERFKTLPNYVLDRFFKAAMSDDVYVRRSAVYSLGFLKEHSVVLFLNNILFTDSDVEVREYAILSLGRLKNQEYSTPDLLTLEPTTIDNLIHILDHENPSLREKSAYVLGFFKYPSVTGALIKSLKDKEPEVRATSARSLGFIRDDNALIPLQETLKDDNFKVIASVSKSLGKFKDHSSIEHLIIARSRKVSFTKEAIDWAINEINR